MMERLITILKGGPGSGNFGHSGRPGEVGGSGGSSSAGGGGKGETKESPSDIADKKGYHYDTKTGKLTVRIYLGTDPITFKSSQSAIKRANSLVRFAERDYKERNYISRSARDARANSISRAKLALKGLKSLKDIGRWFAHHGTILGVGMQMDNTQF